MESVRGAGLQALQREMDKNGENLAPGAEVDTFPVNGSVDSAVVKSRRDGKYMEV